MGSSGHLGEIWTPSRVIQWATAFLAERGVQHPRLDAETLVAHALNLDRLKVYLHFDKPLNREELSIIRKILTRRSRREPLQYITGMREFYGIKFKVSPSVLIPRPETEDLVEKALRFLNTIPEEKRQVLDLGTGSGCIAISIALNISCRVWAVDISVKALEVAKENENFIFGFSQISWRLGRWFSALKVDDPTKFSVIACNPPYVADIEKNELMPEVADFEPAEALFSGKSGLEAYAELAPTIWEHLQWGGKAYLELHAKRADKIAALFDGFPWKGREVLSDLQGLPRILILEKPINP